MALRWPSWLTFVTGWAEGRVCLGKVGWAANYLKSIMGRSRREASFCKSRHP